MRLNESSGVTKIAPRILFAIDAKQFFELLPCSFSLPQMNGLFDRNDIGLNADYIANICERRFDGFDRGCKNDAIACTST